MSAIKMNRAINKLNSKVTELEKEMEGLSLAAPARPHIQGQIKGLRYAILTLDVLKKSADDDRQGRGHQ